MRRSFNPGKEPSFQKIFISSFVIHLVFIVVTAVPLVHKKREIKNYYVNLVSPAAVHRPETVSSTVSAEKDKAVTTIKKKIPITKPVKQKAKMSLKSDKVDNAIDNLKAKKAEDKKKQDELNDLRSRLKSDADKTKDAAGFTGSNLYAGMGGSDAREKYENNVHDIIFGYWIPEGSNIEDIEAVVDIRVDKNWKIISFKMIDSSGNKLFDRSVFKAMQDAREGTKIVPLPAPPLEMMEEVLEDGFEFTFSRIK